MGKTPQQRRKLKTNKGKKAGLSRRAQKVAVPKQREVRAASTNITNAVVKEAWDVTKTRRKNFADIGLIQDPNEGDARRSIADERKKSARVPTAVVKKLEELAESARGAKPVVASAGEIQFVDSLVSKYGSDYKAMARDHKLNYYQHTAKQIEGKIKRVQATLALAEEMGVE